MGKINSKSKGANGERELANVLKAYGYDASRGVQYQGGPDSPDVTGLDGVHIECKRVERLNISEAMTQSIKDAGDLMPVVMHRKNREKWLVTMRLEDFMKLYGGKP